MDHANRKTCASKVHLSKAETYSVALSVNITPQEDHTFQWVQGLHLARDFKVVSWCVQQLVKSPNTHTHPQLTAPSPMASLSGHIPRTVPDSGLLVRPLSEDIILQTHALTVEPLHQTCEQCPPSALPVRLGGLMA